MFLMVLVQNMISPINFTKPLFSELNVTINKPVITNNYKLKLTSTNIKYRLPAFNLKY